MGTVGDLAGAFGDLEGTVDNLDGTIIGDLKDTFGD
jgi:hypothetical protein